MMYGGLLVVVCSYVPRSHPCRSSSRRRPVLLYRYVSGCGPTTNHSAPPSVLVTQFVYTTRTLLVPRHIALRFPQRNLSTEGDTHTHTLSGPIEKEREREGGGGNSSSSSTSPSSVEIMPQARLVSPHLFLIALWPFHTTYRTEPLFPISHPPDASRSYGRWHSVLESRIACMFSPLRKVLVPVFLALSAHPRESPPSAPSQSPC
ncbi:hypothetical protein LZ30DRAFT_435785 [Colletotrichum cereale]|nr:hypothetical protein LZ30DRAFT_435785 [Colletotrichum cereale]